MRIHEFQAKALLREYGVPVPKRRPRHLRPRDNGIIPMKELMADNDDPVVWLLRKFRGQRKSPA
jgi:hypothetical protein